MRVTIERNQRETKKEVKRRREREGETEGWRSRGEQDRRKRIVLKKDIKR